MKSALKVLISATVAFPALPAYAKPKSTDSRPAHTQPIENDEKGENSVEKFQLPDENKDCEGDPYLQCPTAKLKDGNCDPTFLKNFYDGMESLSCQLTRWSGSCLEIRNDDQGPWPLLALAAGTGGAYARSKMKLNALQDAHYDKMIGKANEARTLANEAKLMKQLEEYDRKMVEWASLRDMADNPVHLNKKNLNWAKLSAGLWGMGAAAGTTLAVGLWYSEHGKKAMAFIAPKDKNCEPDELNADFTKYVPIEPNTCSTPIYLLGHPRVVEFLKLPLKDKLEKLKSSERLCGYYKSLNDEIEKRLKANSDFIKIHKVQCDQQTGTIQFALNKKSDTQTVSYKIERKPGTEEFTSYSFEKKFGPVVTKSAVFDLAKTEDDISLIKVTVQSGDDDAYTITQAQFDNFIEEQSEKSAELFTPFRAIRRYSRNLALCCDIEPPVPPTQAERADRKKRGNVKVRDDQIAAYQRSCRLNEWFDGKSPREAAPKSGKATSAK